MQTFQSAQRFVSTRVLATRQGTIMLGVFAAVLAGLVLLVYLNRYRESVASGGEPVTVLVAKRLIEKGTPGDAVGVRQSFELADTPRDYVKEGAFTDPAALRGKVAVADVLPGQQLTAAEFAPATVAGGLGATLVDSAATRQAAIAVPIDAARGLVGRVQPGDRVDVFAAFDLDGRAVVRMILQDVYVLDNPTPGGGGGIGGGGGSNILLRVTPGQAGKLVFASKNGEIWVTLRPRTGARPTKPSLVTTESLLTGGGKAGE